MTDVLYHFNGIDASTGKPLHAPKTASQIAEIALLEGEHPDVDSRLGELHRQFEKNHRGVIFGVDPTLIAEAGWAVIFSHATKAKIREVLQPLLCLRNKQAGAIASRRYRELLYETGESAAAFLERHRVCWGPADPDTLPYYLLIVGTPQEIPLSFQYELCQYAVGRICFQTIAEYKAYVEQVIQQKPIAKRSSVFFGPSHEDDICTEISSRYLIDRLAENLATTQGTLSLKTLTRKDADREKLLDLIEGERCPDLLFTALHGVYVDPKNVHYPTHMGALVCADWSGPKSGPLSPAHYLAADHLTGNESPRLVFLFACYSGGITRFNDFSREEWEIASETFIAHLPNKLLTMGTGAVVAHMGGAYGYSFMDAEYEYPLLATFKSCFRQLHQGHPVGYAMESFRQRYAALHTHLAHCRERERLKQYGRNDLNLATLWMTKQDTRNYIIIGDPAVSL